MRSRPLRSPCERWRATRNCGDSMDFSTWRAQFAAEIIGESPEIVTALETIRQVASSTSTILITGETGSGKELFARAVHRASPRRARPFIPINCGAIPEQLLETELFGHIKGAFTGAHNARAGRFMAANEGTIFLDEIGELPLSAQAKLLRVLEERVVTPVGSDSEVPVNVRIVVATHRDLASMVAQGTFRADLFFRLSVVPVELPALRQRPGDILELAEHYITTTSHRLGRSVVGLDATGRSALLDYSWPGNVRELSHVIERAVLLARTVRLGERDFQLRSSPPVCARGTAEVPKIALGQPPIAASEGSLDLRAALDNVERQLIERALQRASGNRTEAAVLLGLNRTTLVEKLRKYSA